ncbi:metallophosphoesterase family protein [Pararhodobacter aggregans]|uniref:YfcE family phosphodiesterase n=1 Tax=Pararhodobacter aggregans TaxID=404875 RepID=A0A2T7ULW6_9RHOB|nr:metallophosphoesterase family protein [Pararhodobacter aggregans]PTX02200.1 putative phosphodiesterase [Pararhodobacter aggregans]PVE45657.1 YfcE family phosphodiesterase [Pararhodobacter aggregans]
MKRAILADIHGNADALAAVLADLAGQGVDEVLILGDHFSGPLAARETWALLKDLKARAIRGNHDRYLLEVPRGAMGRSDAAAHDDLPPGALDWLASLPPTLAGGDFFACHGTPASDETYLCERITPDGGVAQRDAGTIARLLAGIEAPLILCAHSHLPRALRLPDGRRVVNPGSVGCPAYTDATPVPHAVEAGFSEASYAILDGATVTFRRVPYDSARMAARARSAGRPEWARALATGWIAS